MITNTPFSVTTEQQVQGEFISMAGERYYVIRNSEKMSPFFMSMVSGSDHWLFVASSGAVTAGRQSPETALFPYSPVDRVYESAPNTGCKTVLLVSSSGQTECWEPFNKEASRYYQVSQNIYKSTLGDKICFEEINHDLQLSFRYTWATSDEYGFYRQCELHNHGNASVVVNMLDGLQNILPAGTPRLTQSVSSNLVDAYKFNELDEATGLGLFTLYSGIVDRAEPSESLKASTVFCLGLDNPHILLSNQQLDHFRLGQPLQKESYTRGLRGAYLVQSEFELPPTQPQTWQIVANVEQSQSQVSSLIDELTDKSALASDIQRSVQAGSDALERIMASADGFQVNNQELVSVHHYANTLFNTLRGGIFAEQYWLSVSDFMATVKHFNQGLFETHQPALKALPSKLLFAEFKQQISAMGDKQLQRLAAEYLPITFGRRHGDPSRPWNQFLIKLKDDAGNPLLAYQGNWRDIFQNWEALCFSYPEFTESVIAKFVNASTIDGYNPYRITKGGIDWEVEEPEDPWSFIGYWGDHQIIYLLKMLEQSQQFHPQRLITLLREEIYSYANVPYRIKSFEDMLVDAKNTVLYDENSAANIAERVKRMGADGKLILDSNRAVYQVNLLEKLLVPLLCKLSNLVLDGGIWINAQRPEWNDANNALVGNGLSMVTLNYMRRYVQFFQGLLETEQSNFALSYEVSVWLTDTAEILAKIAPQLGREPVSSELRYQVLAELGQSAYRYRGSVYATESFSHKVEQPIAPLKALLNDALLAIDHSIHTNSQADGLQHAYNLLVLRKGNADIRHLYPMLEGQVAALSSGALGVRQAADVLDALFESDLYRDDIHTFMLYPDRPQTRFLDKNVLPADALNNIPLLQKMLDKQDSQLVLQDSAGRLRFNANLKNAGDVDDQLALINPGYRLDEANKDAILALYEQVFNHQAFTDLSGGMFSFEGLGCVYWHMVAKLLLAASENFYRAIQENADAQVIQRLGELYYRVRAGIGFNKTPSEYGAFPFDPIHIRLNMQVRNNRA